MFRYYFNDEFFGSMLFDAKTQRNMALDKECTALIRILSDPEGSDVEDVSKIQGMAGEDLKELLGYFKSIGLLKVDLGERKLQEVDGNRLRAPLRVFYDITYACNLRCIHCFTDSGTKDADELSLDEKLTLAENLSDLGVHRVSIAGGEPLICPDTIPFIERCRELGLAVSMTTNGTLMDEKTISILNRLSLKSLTVSIDGVKEKSIGRIRGMTAFYKASDALKLLKKSYLGGYSIKATLMKPNIDELEDIVRYAVKYGCGAVKFNCVRLDGRANENASTLGLTREEYIRTVKKIESLKQKYEGDIAVKGPLNIFSKEQYDYIHELGFGCFGGKESICIDPMGNVRPCAHFPEHFICGNVREQSIGDIWRNSIVLKQFAELEGNETCRSCTSYNKCRSGCRFRAYCAGDINGIDPYCYLGVESRC